MVVITYGMGVHWALNASKAFPGQVEILDLRTLYPYDWEAISTSVKRHNKCFVLRKTELSARFKNEIYAFTHGFHFLIRPFINRIAVKPPEINRLRTLQYTILPVILPVES